MKKVILFTLLFSLVVMSGCSSEISEYEKNVIVLRDNLGSKFYYYGEEVDFNYDVEQVEIVNFCDFSLNDKEQLNIIFYDLAKTEINEEQYSCIETVVERTNTFIVFLNSEQIGDFFDSLTDIDYDYRNTYNTKVTIFFYKDEFMFSGLRSSNQLSEDDIEKKALFMLVSILEDYYD